ncbi:MAG: IS5 family transposase [Mesorhizobium sp.]|nr:MAG: IS5 family transposase [Mesorhizobium sp.]
MIPYVRHEGEMIRMVDRVLGQLSLADGLVWSDVTELDQISRVIDWVPIKALLGQRSGPGRGNISYPAEALLRCLLLGVWNNLSDPSLEAQLRDRLSFRRFAGFSLSDPTPDHSTLWRFREELKCDGLIDRVFYEITRQLEQKGLIVKRGTLIDASFMQAAARPPAKPEATARPSADGEARWGRKGNKTVFGYKVHNSVDDAHTLIRRMDFTDASVTDTEPADGLIIGDEKAAYGDQAYYTHARHPRLKPTRGEGKGAIASAISPTPVHRSPPAGTAGRCRTRRLACPSAAARRPAARVDSFPCRSARRCRPGAGRDSDSRPERGLKILDHL